MNFQNKFSNKMFQINNNYKIKNWMMTMSNQNKKVLVNRKLLITQNNQNKFIDNNKTNNWQ